MASGLRGEAGLLDAPESARTLDARSTVGLSARLSPIKVILRALLMVLLGTVWWTATNGIDVSDSDATGDWIFIQSVVDGSSPFEGLTVLGKHYGVAYRAAYSTGGHDLPYRTPGGLALLSPLLLVRAEHAHLVMNVAGLVAFSWLAFYAIPRICRRSLDHLILPIALAIASVAVSDSFFWGNGSPIVAALSAWILIHPRSEVGGGFLGLATLMKLYPGLLTIPLLAKKAAWRAAFACAGVFVAGNVLGALVFRIPLADAVSLIVGGLEEWQGFEGNSSVAAWLLDQGASLWIVPFVTVAGFGLVVIHARTRSLSASLLFATCVAVLVSPVSWTHYGLLVLPAVIFLWSHGPEFPLGRMVSGAWLVIGVLTYQVAEILGTETARGVVIALRIALAFAVGLAPASIWYEKEANEGGAVPSPATRPPWTELAL